MENEKARPLPIAGRRLLDELGTGVTPRVLELVRELCALIGRQPLSERPEAGDTISDETERADLFGPEPREREQVPDGLWAVVRELEVQRHCQARQLNGLECRVEHNNTATDKRFEALRAELGESSE